MSAGTLYWAVIGDADGNVTDYATVLQHTANLTGGMSAQQSLDSASSTTGWNTNPTWPATGWVSSIVLGFSGFAIGSPFSAQAASTNGTNQRGFYISGLTESLKVWGMMAQTQNANISGLNIWSGSGGPTGSPDTSGAIPINWRGVNASGWSTTSGYTLAKATAYRIVFTYSASTTVPSKYQIGTGADATLKSAMVGGGGIYWAEANGTTNWNNDNTAEFGPTALLLIDDQVAVTGGAAGPVFNAGRPFA